jgi:hypothetical protein
MARQQTPLSTSPGRLGCGFESHSSCRSVRGRPSHSRPRKRAPLEARCGW